MSPERGQRVQCWASRITSRYVQIAARTPRDEGHVSLKVKRKVGSVIPRSIALTTYIQRLRSTNVSYTMRESDSSNPHMSFLIDTVTSARHQFPLCSCMFKHILRVVTKMPKAPSASNAIASSSTLTPKTYRALKTEQGVFTTPPYSGELKGLWKFKDEDTARQSAESLWERFEGYRYVIV